MTQCPDGLSAADLLAVQRLLSDFTWCADRGDAAGLADLFLADGVLQVGAVELTGRHSIEASSRQRFAVPDRKTRHVWSNLRACATGEGQATATLVQMTFEQGGPEMPVQLRVNDVSDVMRKDADGQWRFARRVVSSAMAMSF